MSIWIGILLIVLLVGSCVVLILQRRHIREMKHQQKRLENRLRYLEEEQPVLAQMAQLSEDDETFQLIHNRYDLLAEILAASVSGDAEHINAALELVDQLVA